MSNASLWEMGWHLWCIFAAIAWPLSAMFGGKKKALTDDERWEIFHELVDTPQLMADRKSYQRIRWDYVACEAPATSQAAAPGAQPAIVRGGRVTG